MIERCTYLGYRWPSYEVGWDGRAALAVTRAVSGTPVVVLASILGFSVSLERLVGDLQLARTGALGDEPDDEEREPKDPVGGSLVRLHDVDEGTVVVADSAGEVVVAIRTTAGWALERQMGLPDVDVELDSLLAALCEIGSRP